MPCSGAKIHHNNYDGFYRAVQEREAEYGRQLLEKEEEDAKART